MSVWPQLRGSALDRLDPGGRLVFSTAHESVREVLLHILLTAPGERLMRPDFGAGLLRFVHRPNNTTTRHLLADTARKAIEQWEPRIVVESVSADGDALDPTLVHLRISYRLRSEPATQEFGLQLQLEAS